MPDIVPSPGDPPAVPAISIKALSFSYGGPNILSNVHLSLPVGARCLLVGANGAGKTTLLRILAGKRLVKDEVHIFGRHAYFDTPDEITYLDPEWVRNPVTKSDLQVSDLLESRQASEYPARLATLLEILEIDPNWHTHEISDGQRRRVQILLGLLVPYKVLLMDEVTVDLDVLCRRDILNFLERESTQRNATIIYCTHIFDGLSDWPTHICRMRHGHVVATVPFHELMHSPIPHKFDSPLLQLIEAWFREDRKFRQTHLLEHPETKHPTKWDQLKDDMKKNGDKYYDYWLRPDSIRS